MIMDQGEGGLHIALTPGLVWVALFTIVYSLWVYVLFDSGL